MNTALADLDDRIAAAFADGAKSDDVASLIGEVEAAAIAVGEMAERARSRALDPVLSAPDVAAARREMDDAEFRRDRMQVAVTKLGVRLSELRAQEEDHRRRLAYERARAERDKLAVELKDVYPALAARIADLAARVGANDREIVRINTRAMPDGLERLAAAELVARGLTAFVSGPNAIPRITTDLHLPAFEFRPLDPYVWPRSR
jgi:hypothetical protein